MNSADSFIDIAKIVGVISPDVIIKVYGDANGTFAVAANGRLNRLLYAQSRLSGHADEKMASIICYGKLHAPIAELVGRTVGLFATSVLSGMANTHQSGQFTLEMEAGVPVELHLDSGGGYESWYRFTRGDTTNELVKIPAFIGDVCDVTFSPSLAAIKLFRKETAEAKKKGQKWFWPMMNSRGYLFFSFDQNPPDNLTNRFEMARNLPNVQLPPCSYSAEDVSKILKLASEAQSITVGISKQGFLQFDIDTGIGRYQFIVLGSDHLIWSWDWAGKFPKVWNIEAKIRDDACMHVDWEPEL